MAAVRTKTFLHLNRRKEGDALQELPAVHIPQKDIERFYFPWPAFDRKKELKKLVEAGELRILEATTATGRKIWLYRALKDGPLDLGALPVKVPVYDALTLYIRDNLMLIDTTQATEYFTFFLEHRARHLDHFFKVDNFSGRIHTPITNLKGAFRHHLTIEGEATNALDVAQMQPQLLGWLLKKNVGPNPFSNILDQGADIYEYIAEALHLETRDQAKEKFYQITFAPPSNELEHLFGCQEWISWVNWLKGARVCENPHSARKPHSNLAWLLQTEEVKLMRKVWARIQALDIPFATVHDEIIIPSSATQAARQAMQEQLSAVFVQYRINHY
jgi:uncharacterized protein YceK